MWTQNIEMPTNLPPVPAGFDWQMWLGPVPDRPYSPDYTHTMFRGWYDFGGGSFADMGHYTMWTVCDAWDLDVPAWVEGFGSSANDIIRNHFRLSIYSFQPIPATFE